MPTPAIFPTLIGLGFSVIKRPIFYNSTAEAASGWQYRQGFSSVSRWEFDLTYDVLTDFTSSSDLKKLLGFYLAMQGDLTGFLFLDPDDNAILLSPIGATDGTTTTWTLTLPRQSSYQTRSEPIGYLNVGQALNVYVNAVLQSAATYDVLTSAPGKQQIRFHTAPASGQAITADFSFYYYVHFKDQSIDFEKFANQMWTVKKLTLESLGG